MIVYKDYGICPDGKAWALIPHIYQGRYKILHVYDSKGNIITC